MSTIVLMAGGTGGHLFPAMALAQELRRRGHDVHLTTDHRVEGYGDDFPATEIHIIPSASPSLRNPVKLVAAGFKILGGIIVAWRRIRRIRPDAAVAFGGYPCFPPFVATSMLGVPGVLHEANAVMGRANRALARFADALALTFEDTKFADRHGAARFVTGNPVRDNVIEAAKVPYEMPGETGPLKLLIFGGSQGARAMTDIVPQAVSLLPDDLRARLRVTQQSRPEDLDRAARAYRDAHVSFELASFFNDLPARIAASHLVISRAGASTVAELAAIGRPAILVPLPGSIDQDQRANATMFDAGGGGWLIDQDNLSPQLLANRLRELFTDPAGLRDAAARAKTMGHPDAVSLLADLVERLARRAKNEGPDA